MISSITPDLLEIQRKHRELLENYPASTIKDDARFCREGEEGFKVAVSCGLRPHHSFLEQGCGVFQYGYWFLKYLYDWNYFALDSSAASVYAGMQHMIPHLTSRMGNYKVTEEIDFGLLYQKFDFVFAGDLWLRLGRSGIQKSLDSFKLAATSSAKYLVAVKAVDVDWLYEQGEARDLAYTELSPSAIANKSWIMFETYE